MNNDCAVALGWKPRRGRDTDADPKQPGFTLWRRKETDRQTDRDEIRGQEQDRQQTTTSSGGKMSGPCVPPGAERFNFNYLFLRNHLTSL